MPMTVGQFRALTEPGLSNIWHEAFPGVEEEVSRVFNIRDQEKLVMTDAKMAGFDGLQTIAEGGPVQYGQAIPPITRDYDFTIRGKGYKVTRKLMDWELYGQVAKFEQDLLESSKDDIQTYGFAVINNATGTTVSAGFDGLALVSTAHTRMDGGATQSNRLATLAAPSVADMQTALAEFNKLVNDRGRPMRIKPVTLLSVPDLEHTFREILESAGRPDTTNNVTNTLSGSLQLMISRYVTGTTHWSILGDTHDINFIWAMRPETSSEEDFDTETMKRKVIQGYARGHGEWRGYFMGNS